MCRNENKACTTGQWAHGTVVIITVNQTCKYIIIICRYGVSSLFEDSNAF